MSDKNIARTGANDTGNKTDCNSMEDKDNNNQFSPQFDPEDLAGDPQAGNGITPEAITAEIDKASHIKRASETTGEDLLLKRVENIPCLLDPFLQQTGLAALAGSSDTGKSTILRQLAIAVAAGKPRFLGWQLNTRHQSAIVVSTEDDATAISYLLSRQARDIDPARLRSLRFIFDFENLFVELEGSLTAAPADLVVIDCYADVFGNDLKDTTKIRSYLNKCQRIANNHECLFLFLHHTGKRSENYEPNKNNLLSGQGFEAKMRLVIELRADPARADIRHLCIVKGNYLAAEHKRESYVLDFDPGTFSFSETMERTPFELLVKKADDEGRAKYEQAKALREEGKTLEEIAQILGYANRGGVSKLLKKFSDDTPDED